MAGTAEIVGTQTGGTKTHVLVDSAGRLLNGPAFASYTATDTATALLTVSDIQNYSQAILVISGLTGETVTITGTNGQGNSVALYSLTSAGAAQASTGLGNGTFYLTDLTVVDLVFTKSAGVESATVDIDLK